MYEFEYVCSKKYAVKWSTNKRQKNSMKLNLISTSQCLWCEVFLWLSRAIRVNNMGDKNELFLFVSLSPISIEFICLLEQAIHAIDAELTYIC